MPGVARLRPWINEKSAFSTNIRCACISEATFTLRLRDPEGLHVSSKKNPQGSKTKEVAGGTEEKTVS